MNDKQILYSKVGHDFKIHIDVAKQYNTDPNGILVLRQF